MARLLLLAAAFWGACGDHEVVLVAGFPKCGTSQLDMLLRKHPDIVALRKEVVPEIPAADWAAMLKHFQKSARKSKGRISEMRQRCVRRFPGRQEVCEHMLGARAQSGAKGSDPVVAHTQFHVLKNTELLKAMGDSVKVIVLVRDPADWLWAVYNFFVRMGDTAYKEPGEWVNKSKHYRSPEHFHETLRGGNRLSGFNLPALNLSELSLKEQFGPRLLVLRSEDLSDISALSRVASFIGVPVGKFDAKLVGQKTNSQYRQASRGPGSVSDAQASGIYEVSDFRPILCKSRQMIYEMYRGECRFWQSEFNLSYLACLTTEVAECPCECSPSRDQHPDFLRAKPSLSTKETMLGRGKESMDQWSLLMVASCTLSFFLGRMLRRGKG